MPASTLVTARLFSVVFVSGSLPLYWMLVREIGASGAVPGTSIALFTAVPIVPALAATVNYDTLMILVTPPLLLVALRVYKSRCIRSSSFLALSPDDSKQTLTSENRQASHALILIG